MTNYPSAAYTHFDQQRIVVAIRGDRQNLQAIAAGFAFHPKPLASATEERYETASQRLFERFSIHEAEHEHFAGSCVLDDCRHESLHFPEIDLVHCSGVFVQKQKTR